MPNILLYNVFSLVIFKMKKHHKKYPKIHGKVVQKMLQYRKFPQNPSPVERK